MEGVLERGLAADDIVDDRGALVGHPQPDRARALLDAAEAAVVVGLLVGLDLVRAGRGAVGLAGIEQLLDDRRRGAAALWHW